MIEDWEKNQHQNYDDADEGNIDTTRFMIFTSLLPSPPCKILDCGCSGGEITKTLQKFGYEVIGTDFPEVIKRTSLKYPELNLIPSNLNKEIPNINNVDWIYASEILEHLVYDFDFLTRCHTILRDNGKIFLTVPRRPEKWNAHLRFYPIESLINLAALAGFKFLRSYLDSSSTIYVGEKR